MIDEWLARLTSEELNKAGGAGGGWKRHSAGVIKYKILDCDFQ